MAKCVADYNWVQRLDMTRITAAEEAIEAKLTRIGEFRDDHEQRRKKRVRRTMPQWRSASHTWRNSPNISRAFTIR